MKKIKGETAEQMKERLYKERDIFCWTTSYETSMRLASKINDEVDKLFNKKEDKKLCENCYYKDFTDSHQSQTCKKCEDKSNYKYSFI